ncbi:archease [Candidatus Woesearchaeota archaeon]|nr:archease [Candidatus Woesearchaeota archaeon]
MKKFELVEGITDADYAFKIYGKNLEELFTNAGMAIFSVMVDPKSVSKIIEKEIKLENNTVEKLLFEFLEELVFLKDAESFMLKEIKVKINEFDGKFLLNAKIFGEELNMEKHKIITDVKSVTYHNYKVEKTSKGWEATVVVDV